VVSLFFFTAYRKYRISGIHRMVRRIPKGMFKLKNRSERWVIITKVRDIKKAAISLPGFNIYVKGFQNLKVKKSPNLNIGLRSGKVSILNLGYPNVFAKTL